MGLWNRPEEERLQEKSRMGLCRGDAKQRDPGRDQSLQPFIPCSLSPFIRSLLSSVPTPQLLVLLPLLALLPPAAVHGGDMQFAPSAESPKRKGFSTEQQQEEEKL